MQEVGADQPPPVARRGGALDVGAEVDERAEVGGVAVDQPHDRGDQHVGGQQRAGHRHLAPGHAAQARRTGRLAPARPACLAVNLAGDRAVADRGHLAARAGLARRRAARALLGHAAQPVGQRGGRLRHRVRPGHARIGHAAQARLGLLARSLVAPGQRGGALERVARAAGVARLEPGHSGPEAARRLRHGAERAGRRHDRVDRSGAPGEGQEHQARPVNQQAPDRLADRRPALQPLDQRRRLEQLAALAVGAHHLHRELRRQRQERPVDVLLEPGHRLVPAARVEIGHDDALVERAARHRLGQLIAPLAQTTDRRVDLAAAHLEDCLDELALLARAHAGLEQLAGVDKRAGQAQAVDQERAAGQVAQDRRHQHQTHAATDGDGAGQIRCRALARAAPRRQRADGQREVGEQHPPVLPLTGTEPPEHHRPEVRGHHDDRQQEEVEQRHSVQRL